MVSQPTHPILYLRAANHRRGFKRVVCETYLVNVRGVYTRITSQEYSQTCTESPCLNIFISSARFLTGTPISYSL